MASDASARNHLESMLVDESVEPTNLPISLLESITNSFSNENRIGDGGFAVVYKGELQNGTVAVKKLINGALDMDENQFLKEAGCLIRVKHKNIVRFLGYCADIQRKMLNFDGNMVLAEDRIRLLCSEFMPKGSLDKYIHDASGGLEWSTRYEILKGICEGLHYLQQHKIVHLDLKPANILLDNSMVPKITDFGISKCFDENQTRVHTLNISGTRGYMAPESHNGEITLKSDIYSLGIIIMEILTGRRDCPGLENILENWSARLETSPQDIQLKPIAVCAKIGIECTDPDPAKRPDTGHIIERLAELEREYSFMKTARLTSSATNSGSIGSDGKVKLDVMGRVKSIPSTTGTNEFPVLVRVTAPLRYTKSSRVGLDLIAVLSISKSMSSNALDSMKQAMVFVVDKLGPKDRLSVVFVNKTRCLMELSTMTDENRVIARHVVHKLQAEEYTNMRKASYSIRKAAEILRQRGPEERSNRVGRIMLLSDNGDYDVKELTKISHEFPTETFGLGAYHSHVALGFIARKTRGVYSYVTQDLEKTKDALAQSLGGLMSVTAMDVKINLQTLDGVTIKDIKSGGYPMSISSDKMFGTIEVADLYAGEQKNLMILMNVPEGDQTRLMTVSGSYRNPKIRKEDSIQLDDIELAVTRQPEAATTVWDGTVCPDVAAEILRLWLIRRVGTILDDGDDAVDTKASDRQDLSFGFGHWLKGLYQRGVGGNSCKQQQNLQRFWEQVKGSELGRSVSQSAMLALDEDVANIQKETSMFIFSWMSSHEMQRATTKGSPTKSSAFRVKAMEEMIEKVYPKQKGLIELIDSDNRVKLEMMGRVKSIPSTSLDNKFLVLVRVIAPLRYTKTSRAGLDLIAVLCISQSMSRDNRINCVKEAMLFVIDNLGPDDRLSVVMPFGDSEVQRLTELSIMTEKNRLIARHEVCMLRPSGHPKETLAMEEAAKILRQRGPKERSNRVGRIMLLSDNYDYDAKEVTKISHEFPTDTFGLRGYHSDVALRSIAQKTRGVYSYVTRDQEKTKDALAQSLGGLMSVTAMDVKINLQTLDGVTIEHIKSGGYPMSISSNKMFGTIKVADLYAGEQKNFIVLLNVPEGDQTRLMTVCGIYKNPKIRKEDPIQLDDIELAVTRQPESVTTVSDGTVCPDVAAEILRLWLIRHVGTILDEGDDAVDSKAFDSLQCLWEEFKGSELGRGASYSAILALDEDVANIQMETSKFIFSWMSSHEMQRATTKGSPTKSCAFRVKAMEEMIEKVDTERKSLEVEYVGGKLVHFDGLLEFTVDNLLGPSAEIMRTRRHMDVYKMKLEDGSLLVVKRLCKKFTKGNKEFEAEVAVLGKIRHPNILAHWGYYISPEGDKLLVFDYMPKGSLSAFLHARGRKTPVSWATRMIIAKGMARGLVYLHDNKRIIHGNLTANNVFLDEQGDPKIADVGLYRLTMEADKSRVPAIFGAVALPFLRSRLSKRDTIFGTKGYGAPELLKLEEPNTKTDVYSLGVILLELLTGKPPADRTNSMDLPQWVESIVKEERSRKLFDLELMREAAAGTVGDELMDMLKLALQCVDPSPSVRPDAREVLRQLEKIRPALDVGVGSSGDGHVSVPTGGDDE